MIIYKPNSCNINGKVLHPLREIPEIRIAKKNLGDVCIETFMGKGFDSYIEAIDFLITYVNNKK